MIINNIIGFNKMMRNAIHDYGQGTLLLCRSCSRGTEWQGAANEHGASGVGKCYGNAVRESLSAHQKRNSHQQWC